MKNVNFYLTSKFSRLRSLSLLCALTAIGYTGLSAEARSLEATGNRISIPLGDVIINTQPSSSTVCAGNNTSFTVAATNADNYQWQVNPGGGFSNVTNGGIYSNATTATLNITGATAGMNGFSYRCLITGPGNPGVTNTVTLTVNSAPAITQNPFPSSICESDATLFYISASSTTSYQWQVSDGSGFVNVSNGAGSTGGIYSGATSSVLIVNDAAVAMSGYTYRCIASGGCSPSATSTPATFTVYANVTYYEDWDNDGYGNASVTTVTCTGAPGGFVSNFDDCDDNDPNVYPGAIEICGDGIDNNCDGNVDEGCSTEIIASQCGTTLSTMGSGINAYTVLNAIGYRFRVINGANVQTIEKSTPLFAMTQLASYEYNTVYSIDVAVDFGSGFGTYGTACNIATPEASTRVQTLQCGVTLAAMNTNIYANNVAGATQYRFRIIEGANVQTIDKTIRFFNMTELANYAPSTTYTIDVAVEIGGLFTSYGSSCNITTPAVGTKVQTSQCGATIAALNTPIYADAVPGATQYRFRIINGANVQTIDKSVRYFNLTQLASYAYATIYTVDVAVEYGGVWQPYGTACNVATPNASTKVQASQCGTTLAAVNSNIYADNVAGATQYRFRVINGANVQTIDVASRLFNLTQLPSWAYGTTYTIDVAVNTGAWGSYGTACEVTTPAAVTHVQAGQCGVTLAALNSNIYANNVVGATDYRFRITEGANVQTIDKSIRYFNLTELAAYAYNKTYMIDVAVNNNGTWSPYGPICTVSSPAYPVTQLQAAFCNATVASSSTIYASNVTGAAQYRFRVTEGANVQTIDRSIRNLPLSLVTGVTGGTIYTVDVALFYNGSWTPYGAACNVMVSSAKSMQIDDQETGFAFDAVTFPNPFNDVFGVSVTTESDEQISVTVYDMSGKVMVSQMVSAEELSNLRMGEGYAAGIYQVRVVQGTEAKTLKVIKQ